MVHNLNKLAEIIHRNSRDKGFYDDEREILDALFDWAGDDLEKLGKVAGFGKTIHRWVRNEKLLLVVSEVIEFMESYRKDKGDEGEEMADAIIRLLDVSAYDIIDVEGEVMRKMRKNEGRQRKHGVGF